MKLGLVERSKNNNFVLETKMPELNQNKNSKQPYWSDPVWKLFFYFANKWIAHLFVRVLQNRCSAHIFWDMMAAYEKLIFKFCGTIPWGMVILTASYSKKHFLWKALSTYETFLLVTTEFFWQVLESIHKFIMELHALQYLFVRGFDKQQKRGGIILNFTKGKIFFISYNNQVLLGIIWRCSPPSCTL